MMSSENTPGKKDPVLQPVVAPAMSHPGTASAAVTVAQAPPIVQHRYAGGIVY